MYPEKLSLSTQKSWHGTYGSLDFKDAQPMVVWSDLHRKGKKNVTSWILAEGIHLPC